MTTRPSFADCLRQLIIYFYVESVPFTRDTIEGRTSLGGSESACLGLAKALAARGHDIHIFAAKLQLGDSDPAVYEGVSWHAAETLPDTLRVVPPDVFVSLRMIAPFAMKIPAGLRLLWNQDMLAEVAQVGGALPQIDSLVYVSQYHKQQWEGRDQAVIGGTPSWVTKNGFDHTLIPVWPEHQKPQPCDASPHADGDRHAPCSWCGGTGFLPQKQREPFKFCYISRPERGLAPLLQMWPEIRRRIPEAELHLCRYDSMYDAKGWGKVCAQYDQEVERVNADVGGITWHGQLSKPQLYDLLTSCSLMLYPGVHDFAETSCIAAIEAQACGCVFVGSHRGALPETVGEGVGVLIEGDATSKAYQDSFIEAVYTLSYPEEGPELRADMQAAGKAHVFPAYTFDTIAAEWEDYIREKLIRRYSTSKIQVMRQLLQYDHHVAAKLVAEDLIAGDQYAGMTDLQIYTAPDGAEVGAALTRCRSVISQQDQTAEHYAEFALPTELEAKQSDRLRTVVERLKAANVKCLLDVACGNGSLALMALRESPGLRVMGIDYAEGNIERARLAIETNGFSDRAVFYSVDLSKLPKGLPSFPGTWPRYDEPFDAVFCGEYLEHTAEPHKVIDWLESFVEAGALCLITVPHGPMTELLDFRTPLHRGHTHHFEMRDLAHMLQRKQGFACEYMNSGDTSRANAVGHWIVEWRRAEPFRGGTTEGDPLVELHPDLPAEPLDYWRTILTTRPYQRLVATLITRNSEEWLFKCLSSIWPNCDAILVMDTGSSDGTGKIVGQFPNTHWFHASDLGVSWPNDGFAAARNAILKKAEKDYAADWVLWIDADEHLVDGHLLHKYLTHTSPYNGYIIRQHHLMLDFEKFYDIPSRVFRAGRSIQFYGKVHEQPENEPDKGCFPALDVPEVNIVHYGYETEPTRRFKLLSRNLPLLKQELSEPNPRQMAYVLFMRDLVTVSGYQGADKRLTQETNAYLRSALALYTTHGFNDPAHRLHHLAWPSYQLSLKWLGMGIEVVWSFAAGSPRVNGVPKAERFLARDAAEANRICRHKTEQWLKKLQPVQFDATPWAGAREPDVPAVEEPALATKD